jgi:predicted ATPase
MDLAPFTLTHIEISGYRCFQSVAVGLAPLTVLIGPNDSGKSTFLSAIRAIIGAHHNGRADTWRQSLNGFHIGLGVAPNHRVELRRDGLHSATFSLDELRPIGYFRLPSDGLQLLGPGFHESHGPPSLDERGAHLPGLLDYMLRRNRGRFDAFVAAAKARIDGLEDIEVATPTPAERRVDLKIENGLVLPYDMCSTGVRQLLFYLGLAYHPEPPRLILIEEPENGLHPKRLQEVMALFREMTQGKHGGRASQIILTTHSPLLLDCVDLEADQVLVFRRNDDGSRTAEPVDAERMKTYLDEFMLGEVWLNRDEAGLVRPTPP